MLKELDGFRAIAVLLVVFFHLGFYTRAIPGFNSIVGSGYLGVQIFFILSSFLLSRQFLITYPKSDSKKSFVLKFFKKRFLRIVPLFIFSFIALTVINFNTSTLAVVAVIRYVLFIEDTIKINPVIWSLLVEVRFYLLLPLVMIIVFRLQQYKLPKFTIPLIVVLYCYIYRFYETNYSFDNDVEDRLYSSLSANIDCLGLGIIGTLLYEKYKEIFTSRKLAIILIICISIIIFLLMHIKFTGSVHSIPRGLIVPLNNIAWTALIVITLLLKTSYVNKILSNKIAIHISMISYSVYIWHVPLRKYVFDLVSRELPPPYSKYILITQFCITLIITLIISEISHRLIEKPFLIRKKEL